MNPEHPGPRTANDVLVSEDGPEPTGRVFRSAQDIADAMLERRLNGRQRQHE
jgi:hypothetical protein